MTNWNIKFDQNEIVNLNKSPGVVVRVRIEGVMVYRGQGVMYDVREIDTAIGYPAMQDALQAIIRPVARRR